MVLEFHWNTKVLAMMKHKVQGLTEGQPGVSHLQIDLHISGETHVIVGQGRVRQRHVLIITVPDSWQKTRTRENHYQLTSVFKVEQQTNNTRFINKASKTWSVILAAKNVQKKQEQGVNDWCYSLNTH